MRATSICWLPRVKLRSFKRRPARAGRRPQHAWIGMLRWVFAPLRRPRSAADERIYLAPF